LKLHGSVNWIQQHEEEEVANLDFIGGFFEPFSKVDHGFPKTTGWDKGRKLILPTYLRDISLNPTLLRVWRLAQQSLESATELTVIGFSLNPADHPARMLIASALQQNTQLKRVTVVDPAVRYWGDLLYRRKLKLVHVDEGFESWLLHG